jgi:hypothetical protein
MTTQQAVGPAIGTIAEPKTKTHNPVPWLVGAVVVLAIAVVALGAMLVAPTLTTPKSQAMVDANIAAWNAPAAGDLPKYYAADAIMWASSDAAPAAKGIDEIMKLAQYGGFQVERTGPVTERGNLVWYPAHVATSFDVSGSDAVAVYYLQDGKIVQHWVIWNEL